MSDEISADIERIASAVGEISNYLKQIIGSMSGGHTIGARLSNIETAMRDITTRRYHEAAAKEPSYDHQSAFNDELASKLKGRRDK